MGFKSDRKRLLDDLRDSNFDHQARTGRGEKNLLAAGLISTEQAIEIVQQTSGRDHQNKAHHQVGYPQVWELEPTVEGVSWYIKGYFLGDQTWFISFHPSEY